MYVCDLKLLGIMRLVVEWKSDIAMLNQKVELRLFHETSAN